MSRRRFYAPPDEISGNTVTLSADESHHLMRVLRLTLGEEVSVFDGRGNEYHCRFIDVKGKRAVLEISRALSDVVESPLDLTLAQALAKGEKFDFIVQKATELGVQRIIPLVTEHTDVKLNEQSGKRLERWQRISLESLKQCGRRKLVEITEPATLANFLAAGAERDLMIYFNERGGENLRDVIAQAASPQAVVAVIGPEGGWSDAEIELMNRRGCKVVSLGRRILRTETAAIVALALLQHALGDLSNQ